MSSERRIIRRAADRGHDIVEAIGRIRDFVRGLDYESYAADRKTQSAVERELLIVSEAYVKLHELESTAETASEQRLEARFPDLPWHRIRGIGNVLRHEYDRVDPATIWHTVSVSDDLKRLEHALKMVFP